MSLCTRAINKKLEMPSMVVHLQPFFKKAITDLQNFFNVKVGYILAAVLLLTDWGCVDLLNSTWDIIF